MRPIVQAILCVVLLPACAAAQRRDTLLIPIGPIVISADRAYSVVASSIVRDWDLRLRPRDSAQRLLTLLPGVVIAQHGGGGKAEQLFLRGFDADHGTDVAIAVDDLPVNMVSHAHGQGYADLHFLIPELVQRVEIRKGSFDARDGDFATAGAVNFHTADRIDAPSVSSRIGSFGAGQLLAMTPLHSSAYAALAVHRSRGPFAEPADHERFNGYAKWRAGALTMTGSAYRASWLASGQVPQRAVEAGLISRFGAIDGEGGATSRYDLAARARIGNWNALAFATRYSFQLFSNFTFFLNDSIHGDGIEQIDERMITGARITRSAGAWDLGAALRHDDAGVGLFAQTARQRRGTNASHGVAQTHASSWVQRDSELGSSTRMLLGLRADWFQFKVKDQQTGARRTSERVLASPRLSVRRQTGPKTLHFASFGYGFHSNDARARSPEVPRSRSAELGLRRAETMGAFAVAAWLTDLQSELVFVGDEGTTESSGATRRYGLDAEARVLIGEHVYIDADINLARGRFRHAPADESRIPLAPGLTSTAGITARHTAWTAAARWRFISARPADPAGTVRARAAGTVELFGNWERGPVRVSLAVDNLFDREWNEAQFATRSRLKDEPAAVTELHFTPGSPRAVTLGVAVRF